MRGVKRSHERLPAEEELDDFAEEFHTGCIEYSQISLTTLRHLCKRLAIPCYGARDEVLDRLKAHQRQVTGPHEDPESAAEHVDHGPVPRELVEMEVKMPHFADIFHRHLQSQNVILERTVPTCSKPPQRGPLQHLNKQEQGQPIWALLLRRDVATLVTLFQVLQEKGLNRLTALLIVALSHVLYHGQSIAYFASLLLAHPDLLSVSVADFNLRTAAARRFLTAVEQSVDATLEFFSTLRMARGALVKAGEERVKEFCKTHQIKLLMPCRNPSKWNSLASRSLADVVKDIEQGSLPKCLDAFFSLTELCYKEALDILRAGNMKYYNGRNGSYESIHFVRILGQVLKLQCQDSAACWRRLCLMGDGVKRHNLDHAGAIKLRDQIQKFTRHPAYHLDDLACYLCLQ